MKQNDHSDNKMPRPPRPGGGSPARGGPLRGAWALQALDVCWKAFGLVLVLGLGGLFAWMLFFADEGSGSSSLPPKDPTRGWLRDLDQQVEREAKQWPEKEKHLREAQKRLLKKLEDQGQGNRIPR